jgi:hypothetical protein
MDSNLKINTHIICWQTCLRVRTGRGQEIEEKISKGLKRLMKKAGSGKKQEIYEVGSRKSHQAVNY